MCHTYCQLLDQGSLGKYLNEISSWMNGHPNDVVTVLLTNQDNIPVSKFHSAFQGAGLDKLAFAPSGRLALNQWPTLQQMIDSGKRLVVFMGTITFPRTLPRRLPRLEANLAQTTTPTPTRSTTSSTSFSTTGRRITTSSTRPSPTATSTGQGAATRRC